MIIESIICVLGVGLTIPQIIAESSQFSPASINLWVQFCPQVILIVALIFRLFKKTIKLCLVTSCISLIGIYFLLLFNSQSSSYVICSKFSGICAEVDDFICTGESLQVWQAILYLIGLCVLMVGITLLIKSSFNNQSVAKVVPVEAPKP